MTHTIDEPLRCPCCGNVATPIRRRDSITAMACEICGCRWDEQMRRPAPPADVAAAVDAAESVALEMDPLSTDAEIQKAFAALRAKLGVK